MKDLFSFGLEAQLNAMERAGEVLDVKESVTKVSDINETLAQRGAQYGSFDTHAQYAEDINRVYQRSPNWETMKPDAKEALRIIANKIGRILNGNPEYDDNWHDIAGYATLVKNRIDSGK